MKPLSSIPPRPGIAVATGSTGTAGSTHVLIVGAGPYGLSLGAHLRSANVPFRIFGRAMHTWATQMPVGMKLKSDGFASNLSTGGVPFTLENFCQLTGRPYHATQVPVAVEDFVAYGQEFARRFLPGLDDRLIRSIERAGEGFRCVADDGEQIEARHVVIATGVSLYKYLPEMLAALPKHLVTHASEIQTFTHLAGQRVAVLGRGASSLNAAVLLAEDGAEVTLISRSPKLHVHTLDDPSLRPLHQRLMHPLTPLGPSLRSWFSCRLPHVFQKLPGVVRRGLTYKHLGPAGGAALQGRIDGSFERLMGWRTTHADAATDGEGVRLSLVDATGARREIEVAHVIAGTGYRVSMARLPFLSEALRGGIVLEPNGAPRLDTHFGTSERRLYFVGPAAATSFGPLQRFAAGAEYTSTRLVRHVARDYRRVMQASPESATAATPLTDAGSFSR